MEKEKTTEQSLEEAIQPLQALMASAEDTSEGEATQTQSDSVEPELETANQSSETETDVKQAEDSDLDDSGVPYKNRYMEAVRKLEEKEKRLTELQSKVDQIQPQSDTDVISSFRNMQVNLPSQQMATSPVAQADDGEAPAQFATKQEVFAINQMLAAKNALDSEALKRFPDLYDKSSLLHKETQLRINNKLRRGTNSFEPELLLEAAEASYGKLVAEGRMKPQSRTSDEIKRRQTVDSTTVPVTRKSTSNAPAPKRMSDMERKVLNTFRRYGVKMTDDQYIKNKS